MNNETDVGTIRLIIQSAVAIALSSLLAGIGLAFNAGHENAVVVAAAGALLSVPASCLTGLFGLLAKTSTTRPGEQAPLPVTVDNDPTNPVPTVEATGTGANDAASPTIKEQDKEP